MHFTQEQIKAIFCSIANKENGINELLKLALETCMRAERSIFQEENPDVYANSYRPCKAIGLNKELLLKVTRTRDGSFYPALLAIIRDEDEEKKKLVFSLYKKGLTTEQVSAVFKEIYGKTYSKQQISYLMKESKTKYIISISS